MSLSVNNYEKVEQSLLYLLSNAGDMQIMRLAKLTYLADYLYAKTFGKNHGYLEGHLRFNFGPVPINFYPALKSLTLSEKLFRDMNNIIRLKDRLQLQALVGAVELNDKEKACLDKVIERFSNASLKQVVEAAYATEPMVSIQAKEKNMRGLKMLNSRMDFDLIKIHPLLDNDDVDISFMEDPEFQKNLK